MALGMDDLIQGINNETDINVMDNDATLTFETLKNNFENLKFIIK